MDLQTLIDENKKLEDALKSDESSDTSQESDDTDNEDGSNYSEELKSSQERNDSDAEDLDNDSEEPQPESLNVYDGDVQEFEKHAYEPSPSFLTYEADLDNFNEDAVSTEAQDNSQISLVENEYAEDDYTASKIDDQLDFSVDADPDTNIDISYQNALVFNETYQHHLNSVLETLQEALQENQNRQLEIESELEELEQGRLLSECNKKYSEIKTDSLLPSNPLASNNRKATVSIFAAPYFKDCNLFSHPDNLDTKLMKNGNVDVYLSAPKEWHKNQKKMLYEAVKENALSKRLKQINTEKEIIRTKLNNRYTDEEDRKELNVQLQILQNGEAKIRQQSDADLFADFNEEFSWLEISMQTFDGYFSEKTCRLMWRNVLHPSINKGHWTKKEDSLLKQIVLKHRSENQLFLNWNEVSTKIGHGRSAFHCFMRFRQKHDLLLPLNAKWTYDEDERLKQLVSQCRINKHFVPWPKVSYYMTNRTKDQCYQRYVYSLQSHLRKGVFSENEDFIIIIGVRLFGHNWAKISQFLQNRTPIQIHSRFNTFLNANFIPWSHEEDLKLLKLVREKGYHVWSEISKAFDGRTRSQCRNRFYVVYKLFQQRPETFDLNKMKYRAYGETTLQERRQRLLYENLEQKVNSFLDKSVNSPVKMESTMKKDNKISYHRKRDNKPNQELKKFNICVSQSDKYSSNLDEGDNQVNQSISDNGSDSDFISEDEVLSDISKDNPHLSKIGEGNSTFLQTLSENCENTSSSAPTAEKKDVSKYNHRTSKGVEIPKKYLLDFIRSVQLELQYNNTSESTRGYGCVDNRGIPSERKANSSITKQFSNLLPMKHMSAFVSKTKKGVVITRFKGNFGRAGAVQNTACKQALTDRTLAIYFRPSWPGRVGKAVSIYKMEKSQQDQMRQALAASNFYGKLLHIYPNDIQRIADVKQNVSSGERIDSLLQLYISPGNKNLFLNKRPNHVCKISKAAAKDTYNLSSGHSHEVASLSSIQSAQSHNCDTIQYKSNYQKSIRTYSRKGKKLAGSTHTNKERVDYSNQNNDNRQHNPCGLINKGGNDARKYVKFVPSNNQTLVGLRGLLLQLRTLKSLVYPDGTGIRISLDRIVQEGVQHIDLFSDQKETKFNTKGVRGQVLCPEKTPENEPYNFDNGNPSENVNISCQTKLSPKEADGLLIDRFLSLYFWPAQMSAYRPPPRGGIFDHPLTTVKPSKHENVINNVLQPYSGNMIEPHFGDRYKEAFDANESIAAAEPFDASNLIEMAKVRAATTPLRKIIVVPRSSQQHNILSVPKLEPDIDILDPIHAMTQQNNHNSDTSNEHINVSTNQELDSSVTMDGAFREQKYNICAPGSPVTDSEKCEKINRGKSQDTIICTPTGSVEQNTAQILSTSSPSCSAKYESNNENTSIAPPPPKKRMLLSLEENMHTNVPCDNSANPHSFVKVAKQPKTYSRNRKKPIL